MLLLAGLGVLLLLTDACRKPFDMQYEAGDNAPLLVVDGFIDAGNTESTYRLSYARPVAGDTQAGEPSGLSPILTAASVIIESESGTRYPSTRSPDGQHVISHPVLDVDQRYRLLIQVGDAAYESDFVPVKVSPEISAIDWDENELGIGIYVSTEDPSGQTGYYRWEYEETYRYHAPFLSEEIFENGRLRERTHDELVYVCYTSERSNHILIAHSQDLSRDAIHGFQVAQIPTYSAKMTRRYSILVRQIPMTAEAYAYWEQLRESSEGLGDIFGPMPSEIRGNIHSVTHPERKVIGLVEAATVTERRMYIDSYQTQEYWPVQDPYYSSCLFLVEPLGDVLMVLRNDPGYLPIGDFPGDEVTPAGYAYADQRCVDCRVRGGSLTPPAFWTDR